eukprot:6213028-Pleurochrysis_carterae.AAC.1
MPYTNKWDHPVATLQVTNGTILHIRRMTKVLRIKQAPRGQDDRYERRTKLFFSHIAYGILGPTAHWCRYEWQSRSSLHAHYFLWLKDARDVSFLNEWTVEKVCKILPGDSKEQDLSKDELEQLILSLNARALNAVTDEKFADEADLSDEASLRKATKFWGEMSSRWNDACDAVEHRPDDNVIGPRPSCVAHQVVYSAVRWQLYQSLNGPKMNTVKSYQARSQRANVDFKPLIDQCMVIEY